VLGLDVVVQHAARMRVVERGGELADQVDDRRQRRESLAADLAGQRLDRPSSVSPTSKMVTMCGWVRWPAARASTRNRRRYAGSAATSWCRHLIATLRWISGSKPA